MYPNIPSENLSRKILSHAGKNIAKLGWESEPNKNDPAKYGLSLLQAIDVAVNQSIKLPKVEEGTEPTGEQKIKTRQAKNMRAQAQLVAKNAVALELVPTEPYNIYTEANVEKILTRWNFRAKNMETVLISLQKAALRDDLETIAFCIRITEQTLVSALSEAHSALQRGDPHIDYPLLASAINRGIDNILIYDLTEKHGKELGILRIAANNLVARQKKKADRARREDGEFKAYRQFSLLESWAELTILEADEPTRREDALNYLIMAQKDGCLNYVLCKAKEHLLAKQDIMEPGTLEEVWK